MQSPDGTQFVTARPDRRFYARLLLAWGGVLAAALSYCILHGLVAGDFAFEPGLMIRWAIVHWGAWPLLLPACFWLIRVVERRVSFRLGVLLAAPAAVLGAALFAYSADLALGGSWTFLAALYHMTPIAGGTYLLFVAVGFWMLYPSTLSATTKEARAMDDAPVSLPVWKGQLRTTLSARDIEWARAARNYVEFFANGDSYIMRTSMAELEDLLPDELFLRAHRSYLVNRNMIAGLHGGRTRPFIVVRSGSKLPVGKTYKSKVFDAIESRSAA